MLGAACAPGTPHELEARPDLLFELKRYARARLARLELPFLFSAFESGQAPPPGRPYSVRVTDCEDFQGGRWTYDGHVGTDLALPVGTAITAAAPGHVLRVRNDMNRGGLKVFIDHGGGLITSSNHLARALVREGDAVRRGQVIALSGMSSVDGLLFFPWLAPHLHFNVFLDGRPVDPFARPDETPLWRDGDAQTTRA